MTVANAEARHTTKHTQTRTAQDPRAIRRCKKRVFDLHAAGQLTAWVDTAHGFEGVGGVADAIDYMLRGGHVGKVVIPL